MNLQPYQYFSLFVPLGLTLLGLALLACWRVLPQQRFLLWLSIGYIVPSLTLSLQSLLDNRQLAQWSVVAGTLYLGSFWALAHGLAARYGGRVHPAPALLISAVTLALLFYYSQVRDELWIRTCVLNLALGLLLLLPAPSIFRQPARHDLLEKVLRISYLALMLYTLARPVLIATLIPTEEIEHLTRSVYWVLMLSAALLISIWFLVVLLAITLRNIIGVLRDERDHDPLTRLLNRRAFFEAAAYSLSNPRQAPWVLMACDLDHFKDVNDTWGHAVGDQVLEQFSRLLQSQVRRGDLAARFGGEEFIVLLAHTDMHNASQVAERVRQQLRQTHFGDTGGTVTASFGLTPVASVADLEKALRRADALVYEAKRAGRDRIHAKAPDEPRRPGPAA